MRLRYLAGVLDDSVVLFIVRCFVGVWILGLFVGGECLRVIICCLLFVLMLFIWWWSVNYACLVMVVWLFGCWVIVAGWFVLVVLGWCLFVVFCGLVALTWLGFVFV